MVEAALVAFALAASYLGCASLALVQRPHRAAVAGIEKRAEVPQRTRRRHVVLASAAFAASFASSLIAEGPSFGTLLWVLGLGGAGISVMFTLTYRPHWLRALQRAVARS